MSDYVSKKFSSEIIILLCVKYPWQYVVCCRPLVPALSLSFSLSLSHTHTHTHIHTDEIVISFISLDLGKFASQTAHPPCTFRDACGDILMEVGNFVLTYGVVVPVRGGIVQFSLFVDAKAILEERPLWCYLIHSQGNKGAHALPRGINPKVNAIARLEFELAYSKAVV